MVCFLKIVSECCLGCEVLGYEDIYVVYSNLIDRFNNDICFSF